MPEFVYYARMSPLAPFRKWALRAGIVVALVVSLPLVGLRGVAHADLGDEPSSKSSSSSSSSGDMNQVEDNDKPKDLLEKKPADVALQQKKQEVGGPPFYEKWQFWAIAGAALVGLVALIWGGQALSHQINGGDVRPCNMDFMGRCFGEGR
jgi:hypothetical protein